MLWGVSDLEVVSHAPMAAGATEVVSRWGWRDEEVGWTWAGAEHAPPLEVRVYTSHTRVELYLNGKPVGERCADDIVGLTATFHVPYAAGNLTAVATTGADRRATRTLLTAGAPAAIRLRADRAAVCASRDDLAYVTAEVVDADGRLVPRAQLPLAFSVGGADEDGGGEGMDAGTQPFAAALYRVGSGNPRDLGSFTSSERTTFRGKALAVLRPTGHGASGAVTLYVDAPGLPQAKLRVAVEASGPACEAVRAGE